MNGKFELRESSNGQFYFNLRAGNGEVVLTGEMYLAKASAEKGLASVRVNAPLDAQFERKTSPLREPYFVLKAANGEIIGRSEMYSSPAAREGGIASVQGHAPGAVLADLTGG